MHLLFLLLIIRLVPRAVSSPPTSTPPQYPPTPPKIRSLSQSLPWCRHRLQRFGEIVPPIVVLLLGPSLEPTLSLDVISSSNISSEDADVAAEAEAGAEKASGKRIGMTRPTTDKESWQKWLLIHRASLCEFHRGLKFGMEDKLWRYKYRRHYVGV